MREIKVGGIALYTKSTRCAHACRYCLMGRKSASGIGTRRFIAMVDRFIDWRSAKGRHDFEIGQAINYSEDLPAEDVTDLMALHDRLGWGASTRRVHLGGLPIWNDEEIDRWICARKDAGIETVHTSFAGFGPVHDYWNNRKGDFEYLLRLQRAAAATGLGLRQRLLVVKSTVSALEETMQRLDEIAPATERYFLPFFYRGGAIRYEPERISKPDLRQLPALVRDFVDQDVEHWRSEREWVELIRRGAFSVDRVILHLELDSGNIERLERLSCDDIIDRLTQETQNAYHSLPGMEELASGWADEGSDRIYPYRDDIERLWLDRYLASHPSKFARHLTHLSDRH